MFFFRHVHANFRDFHFSPVLPAVLQPFADSLQSFSMVSTGYHAGFMPCEKAKEADPIARGAAALKKASG
jgi:hypothetical protein